ncbi:proteasome maturation protein [Brevipalpus obovatus]|uniref:proteasome maturation protein n=1 Tax=Brevipalpus obovatus TaxID=246614 RepID=UPI003D9DDCD7
MDSSKINPEKSILLHGFSKSVDIQRKPCPLEESEKTFPKRQDDIRLATLRSEQGIAAPLKLMMERKAASRVGRLPFLASSNLMTEVLTGSIDSIDFHDIYNDPTDHIEVLRVPSLVMDYQQKLL